MGQLLDLWVQIRRSMASFSLFSVIILTRNTLCKHFVLDVCQSHVSFIITVCHGFILHIKFWKNSLHYLISSHENTQDVRNIVSQSVALRINSIKCTKKCNIFVSDSPHWFQLCAFKRFGEWGVYIKYKLPCFSWKKKHPLLLASCNIQHKLLQIQQNKAVQFPSKAILTLQYLWSSLYFRTLVILLEVMRIIRKS